MLQQQYKPAHNEKSRPLRLIGLLAAFSLPAMMALSAPATDNQSTSHSTAQPHGKTMISRAQAEKIALRKAPHGTIREGELETEHGRRIWSFDIARPHTKDITEVQVDVHSGEVVSVKTETPSQEQKEAASERHASGSASHDATTTHTTR